jgi:hypothetical protein
MTPRQSASAPVYCAYPLPRFACPTAT